MTRHSLPASTFEALSVDQHARLREWFPKGSTVYTILRHVSRTGMQRVIGVVSIAPSSRWADGVVVRHPNYATSEVLRVRLDKKREGVVIGGCGMNMGFALVNNLSCALHHEYDCLGDKCPAAVHVNRGPDRDKRGKGIRHKDGCALHQRWM